MAKVEKKCAFCGFSGSVVNHPGMGVMIHHGGNCRNAGAYSVSDWEKINGKVVDTTSEVSKKSTAKE